MIPRPEIDFQRTPVTLIVAGVAVALELACTLRPELRHHYASDLKLGMLSLIWSGEIWRPLSSSLLHVELLHAVFNVYWLVVFGAVLEPYLGRTRFGLLLVLLAYVSAMPEFLASNWDTPLDGQHGAVGLSGVVYGLFGLLFVGRRWRADFAAVCNDSTVMLFIFWFFLCIVMTRLDKIPQLANVANVAHGAGCLFGALYGMALFEPRRRWAWRAAAVVASLLVLGTVIAAPGHPLYEKHKRHRDAVRRWGVRVEAPPPDVTPPAIDRRV